MNSVYRWLITLAAGVLLAAGTASALPAETAYAAEDGESDENRVDAEEEVDPGLRENPEQDVLRRGVPILRSGISDTWYLDYTYTTDTDAGTITITKYNGDDTDVIVPATATIDGTVYHTVIKTRPAQGVFSRTAVETVTLAPGVKVLCADSLFQAAESLRSVDIKEADFSETTSAWQIFYGAKALTQVDLSGMSFPACENFNGAFAYCSELVQADLTGIETPAATNLYGLFSYCKKLKGVLGIGDLDMAAGANIGSLFQMSGLESIDLSGLDVSNAVRADAILANCTELTFADLSDWDCSGMTSISVPFALDAKLAEIRTPSVMNTSIKGNLPDQGDMIYRQKLSEDTYSDEFYTDLMQAPTDATLVLVPGTSAWVKDYSYYLSGGFINVRRYNGSAEEIVLPAEAMVKGVVYRTNVYCSSSTGVYMNNTGIRSVTLEDGVKLTYGYKMFSGCTSLEKVTFGDVELADYFPMNEMFAGCPALEEIDFSAADISKANNLTDFLSGCTALHTIRMPRKRVPASTVNNLPALFYRFDDNGWPIAFAYTKLIDVPGGITIHTLRPITGSFTVRVPALVQGEIRDGQMTASFQITADTEELGEDDCVCVYLPESYLTFTAQGSDQTFSGFSRLYADRWLKDISAPASVYVYGSVPSGTESITEWNGNLTFRIFSTRRIRDNG